MSPWPLKPCIACGGAPPSCASCERCEGAGAVPAPEGARVFLVRPANDTCEGDDAAERDPMPATLDGIDAATARAFVYLGHGRLTPDVFVFDLRGGGANYRGRTHVPFAGAWRIQPTDSTRLELWRAHD